MKVVFVFKIYAKIWGIIVSRALHLAAKVLVKNTAKKKKSSKEEEEEGSESDNDDNSSDNEDDKDV